MVTGQRTSGAGCHFAFRRVAPYTGVRPVVVLVGNIHTLKRIGWLPSVPPRVRAPELWEQLAEAGVPWVSVLQHWPGECAGPGPAGPDRERGGTCRGWDDRRTDGGLCTARSARGSRSRRIVGLSVASSPPGGAGSRSTVTDLMLGQPRPASSRRSGAGSPACSQANSGSEESRA